MQLNFGEDVKRGALLLMYLWIAPSIVKSNFSGYGTVGMGFPHISETPLLGAYPAGTLIYMPLTLGTIVP